MSDDILLKVRQQHAMMEGKGAPQTRAFLQEIADEIAALRAELAIARMRLKMLGAIDTVLTTQPADQVNGHG